ncbi:nucleotide-binding protein [Rhodococcus sp. IEGM 1379]|uniref:nucleotide-binding protein n=1 Tax=Rhodococcus sp. IEGM 1379 TaxID=3047086 RepID=UPI0024B6B12B|nr:nucleotide-binding protein [Rhodococcus sp. IEGM 1379]MDI9915415.1 nucleotide-binding protein [Rhodococcus sp. IEGM 1379]
MSSATDDEAADLLDLLVEELRADRTFVSTDVEVQQNLAGLRAVLTKLGAELDTDGYLSWQSPGEQEPNTPVSPPVFARPTVTPEGTTVMAAPATRDPRKVFLVHGRNSAVRNDFVGFLKALDLKVIEWEEAVSATGQGAPYIGEVLKAGMDMAGAVIVLFTPDDVGCAQPEFQYAHDEKHELVPTGQARLNVIFEAGMAMERDRDRVVLVEVGRVRAMSDTAGVHVIRLRDQLGSRKDLVSRLKTVGLEVDDSGEDWRDTGSFDLKDATQPSAFVDAMSGFAPTQVSLSDESVSSVADPIAILIASVADPARRPELDDLVLGAARSAAKQIREFPLYVEGLDATKLETTYGELCEVASPVLKLLIEGVRHDRDNTHAQLWRSVIEELMKGRADPLRTNEIGGTRFQQALEEARHLPALLALRAVGIAGIATENDGTWLHIATAAKWKKWRETSKAPAVEVLDPYRVLDDNLVKKFSVWKGTGFLYPVSRYERLLLRPFFEVTQPDDYDWRWINDQYEFRRALLGYMMPAPARAVGGEFLVEDRWSREGLETLVDFAETAEAAPESWPWTPNVTKLQLPDVLAALQTELNQWQKWG